MQNEQRGPVMTEGLSSLRNWLDNCGKTRAAVAAEIGISGASLSSWMAGFSRPKSHLRERVAKITGIPPEAWMTDEERRLASGGPIEVDDETDEETDVAPPDTERAPH